MTPSNYRFAVGERSLGSIPAGYKRALLEKEANA
jgi:hypothetical protein